jgi:hypothetical protein
MQTESCSSSQPSTSSQQPFDSHSPVHSLETKKNASRLTLSQDKKLSDKEFLNELETIEREMSKLFQRLLPRTEPLPLNSNVHTQPNNSESNNTSSSTQTPDNVVVERSPDDSSSTSPISQIPILSPSPSFSSSPCSSPSSSATVSSSSSPQIPLSSYPHEKMSSNITIKYLHPKKKAQPLIKLSGDMNKASHFNFNAKNSQSPKSHIFFTPPLPKRANISTSPPFTSTITKRPLTLQPIHKDRNLQFTLQHSKAPPKLTTHSHPLSSSPPPLPSPSPSPLICPVTRVSPNISNLIKTLYYSNTSLPPNTPPTSSRQPRPIHSPNISKGVTVNSPQTSHISLDSDNNKKNLTIMKENENENLFDENQETKTSTLSSSLLSSSPFKNITFLDYRIATRPSIRFYV